jgi:hypothetical protein
MGFIGFYGFSLLKGFRRQHDRRRSRRSEQELKADKWAVQFQVIELVTAVEIPLEITVCPDHIDQN